MKSSPRRIDVHHHIVPPAFAQAMARHGLDKVAGAPLPHWTVNGALGIMDLYDIETAITSLSAPGVHFGDLHEACDLARACNEFSARMVQDNPRRFGFFAVLPMPFTEQSCAEATYALDVLGADGVVLLGSTEGVFLGDPRLDELMAELDRRSALVFEHPNVHATSTQLGLSTPEFLLEFLCDTTRAATNLILSGTLERYPNIRWILSHAGGFLPYVAWRLSLANEMPKITRHAPKGVLHYARSFYYDTALSPSPYAMAALGKLVEPSHILFGSDYPFAPAPAVGMEIKALEAPDLFSPATLAAVNRDNALALLPRFDAFSPPEKPLGASLRSAVTGPIVDLADKFRDR